MDICKTYPKFEADQVLTAEQLNKLFSYLDIQNRWTRKCFIGAGIACGFQLKVNESNKTVQLSAGAGLTTQGYLIKQSASLCTHYTEYTDPVQYSFFQKDESQVALWELLPTNSFDSEDADNKPLKIDFLKDKVALLYLEVKDVDLDTCTGSNCDEKGIETTLCVKILLIQKMVLDQLVKNQSGGEIALLYDQLIKKYQLPGVSLGRLPSLGNEDNLLTLEDIQLLYGRILQTGSLLQLQTALVKAYDVYSPLLSDMFQVNPFKSWRPTLKNPLGIQYFYDHIRDLILAYNEFCEYAFQVFASCCIPDEGFPRHLMVACLFEQDACKPSAYRHHFITASEPAGAELKIERVRSLFRRLVHMTLSFNLPAFNDADIKITPSQHKGSMLSQRSIPYYYDLEKFPQLKSDWNFELENKCQSSRVLNYHDNDCVADCDIKTVESSLSAAGLLSAKSNSLLSLRSGNILGAVKGDTQAIKSSLTGRPSSSNPLEKILAELAQGKGAITSAKDFQKFITGESKFSLVRALDPTHFPLHSDIDEFPFFRIEGHLGKDYFEASSEISQWIKCYNLPIKLVGLKVGKDHSDIDLSFSCEFEDIDLIYQTQSEKIRCYLKQTLGLVESIKFDAPEDNLEESVETKIVGVFVDGKSKSPLASVVYAIQKLRLVAKTDKTGQMELTGLTAGTYTLETFLEGYGSKSFPVSVKSGKTLKLGTIELFQEALQRKKELFFKEKTSDREVLIKAEELSAGTARESKEAVVLLRSKNTTGEAVELLRAKNTTGSEKILKITEPEKASDQQFFINKAESNETFIEKGFAVESADESPYKIGTIYKEFGIAESRDILSSARQYIYERFASSNVKETDDILDKIFQPLQIVTTLNKLLDELESPLLQFDKNYFNNQYQQLLTQIEKFKEIITGDRYAELFSETDKTDIIRYFDLLRQESCFNQFQSLMDAYEQRRNRIQFQHLLSVYAVKNTGLTHLGGCIEGGSFFLIYDDTKRVVLDFALPYICCSDCPPIQYCNGYPVIFKLPQEHFCKTDLREFKFITNFPGGEVIGQGVSKQETSGEFYFRPSAADVTQGKIDFIYFLNEARYELSVLVDEPNVSIGYNLLNVDSENKTAEVKFVSDPPQAQSYLWDFGDGSTSTEASPVKTFDLSTNTTYHVTLEARQKLCDAQASHDLTFEICNATFSVKEVARDLSTISYAFKHPQAAQQRVWDMGDATTVDDSDSFIHTYRRTESATEINVTLSITQESCTDSSTQTLTIPSLEELTIFMDRFSLCQGDDPVRVVFDPENGVYSGNGLVPIDGDIYFHPDHPDVVLGENEISYELEGEKVSATVTVSAINEQFSATINSIDGEKKTADVQFIAPPDLDSYNFTLGDGSASRLPSFIHQYDISAQVKFDVSVQLINGACDVTQTSQLDLTPCSAEFTFSVLDNNGESITIEYNMLEKEGKEYRLTDELGTVTSTSPTFRRSYSLSNKERSMNVSMGLNKPPCTSSFSSVVTIPAGVPLSISMEQTIFVWCDEKSYGVSVNPEQENGVVSGPGIRTQDKEFFFTPVLANTAGNVTLTYTLEGRSASLTVNIKKPQAALELKSIVKIENGVYDVSVINKSIDFNQSSWLFEPGGVSTEKEPVFRLQGVKPGQQINVELQVAWDGLCTDASKVTTFHIPEDNVIVDPGLPDILKNLKSIRTLSAQDSFTRIFPTDHLAIQGTMTALEKIQQELSVAETAASYKSGSKNASISKAFDPVLGAALEQLSSMAINSGARNAQAGYPLYLIMTSQLVDLIGYSDKDISPTAALGKTMDSVVKGFATLLESGIDIDQGGALSTMLENATVSNSSKPNTLKALTSIGKLLG